MKLTRIIPIIAALLAVSCTSKDYKNYANQPLKWSLVIEEDSAPFTRSVLTCKEEDIPTVTSEGKDIILSYASFKGRDIDVTVRTVRDHALASCFIPTSLFEE